MTKKTNIQNKQYNPDKEIVSLSQRRVDTMVFIRDTDPATFKKLDTHFHQFHPTSNYQTVVALTLVGLVFFDKSKKWDQNGKDRIVTLTAKGEALLNNLDDIKITNKDYLEDHAQRQLERKNSGNKAQKQYRRELGYNTDTLITPMEVDLLTAFTKNPFIDVAMACQVLRMDKSAEPVMRSRLTRLRNRKMIKNYKNRDGQYCIIQKGLDRLEAYHWGELELNGTDSETETENEIQPATPAKRPEHQPQLPFLAHSEPEMNLSRQANTALDTMSALIKQNDHYRKLFEDIRNLIDAELNQ